VVRSVRSVVLFLMCTIAWVLGPAIALAADPAACQPANFGENFFAGQIKTVSGIKGTRGIVEGQALALCTAPLNEDSGSQTWVAVTGPNGYTRSLVQTGLIKCKNSANGLVCDGNMRYFWTWGRDSAAPGCSGFANRDPLATSLGTWSSGSSTYLVANNGSAWQVFIGGVFQDSISTASICWTPSQAEWIGESWNKGDDIGGVAGNKQYISTARYQTSIGGSWISPGFSGSICTLSNNPYFCEIATTDQINLWSAH
jgi:hypothetical protein